MEILHALTHEIWHVFSEAAIYILFGLFLAGIIRAFIKQEKIAQHLGKRNFSSVLKSALLGIPLPLCSCGVIPTAMGLRKSGASKGATLSFLISTPESGVDSIALSYAILDPLMAAFRPIAAFLTALVAGVSENIFDKEEGERKEARECLHCQEEGDHAHDHPHSLKDRLQAGIKFAYIDLLGDIGKWFTIGIILAGVIAYFVPESFITEHLNTGWQAYALMLIVGIPLYVCASASTPIAAALILKGMSPGVALVFLLVGPATNIATILVVGSTLGKKSAAIYLISIAICAVLLGLLLNQIYAISGIDVHSTIGKAGSYIPHMAKRFAAIILMFLMANAIGINLRKKHNEHK